MQVSAGFENTFVLLVYIFGKSCFGRFPQEERVNHPKPLNSLGKRMVQVSSAYYHTVFLSREGRLYGFGACGNGELGHEALRSSDFQQLPIDFALNSYPPI